jgi:putative transposase
VEDRGDLDPAPSARRTATAAAAPARLNWADRALLATLLGVIPKARRQGMRLLVTPDTILRWHRDIVHRHWAARSMHGRTGRPATRRNIQALVRRLARENTDYVELGIM